MVDLPDIGAEDVVWACEILGLPPHAFSGADGTDPRKAILCDNGTLDVEACPGSGKTTLLVAKLAILARHWTSRDQGLCVISHTNAARREIEKKLGATLEGQRLLSYPHFVGTIHGFVNEYLALPWLRSKGVTISAIDNELCLTWRWKQLSIRTQRGLARQCERSGKDPKTLLYYRATDFSVGDVRWSRGILGRDSASYVEMVNACRASFEKGLFCHGEMFLWATEMVDQYPGVSQQIVSRFPALFIDEVQDNSEDQSELLKSIFFDGDQSSIRQRFGDQNQAIYDYSMEGGAVTDTFPNGGVSQTIPNSHRFGQSIAALAEPLSVVPHALVGQGGHGPNGEVELAGQHVILLFEEVDIEHVLPSYAKILRETLAPEELAAGEFTAVAAVHATDNTDHVPRSVRHYWSEYDPDITRSDPQPKRMVQFVRAAHKMSLATGEAAEAVEVFANGVLKLAWLMNPDANITVRRFKHRYAIELLGDDDARIHQYRDLVRKLVIECFEPMQAAWEGEAANTLTDLAMAMSKAGGVTQGAKEFLAWMKVAAGDGAEPKPVNVMHDEAQEPPITVRLGSIHSVKGETHTATLVLDSFNRTHHLKALKNWLLGTKAGGGRENASTLRRLKLHYVAMTRPRRLLCLAMRADSFSEQETETLKGRGWRVARVSADGTTFV
ncbi:MAG: UvrD-helicase domain-containing protein [Cyanobacteria bacterium J06638_22]